MRDHTLQDNTHIETTKASIVKRAWEQQRTKTPPAEPTPPDAAAAETAKAVAIIDARTTDAKKYALINQGVKDRFGRVCDRGQP